jgi:hypothetical protein
MENKYRPFIANTSGSFDLTNENMIQQTDLPSVLSVLYHNNCPDEIAIFVHAFTIHTCHKPWR